MRALDIVCMNCVILSPSAIVSIQLEIGLLMKEPALIKPLAEYFQRHGEVVEELRCLSALMRLSAMRKEKLPEVVSLRKRYLQLLRTMLNAVDAAVNASAFDRPDLENVCAYALLLLISAYCYVVLEVLVLTCSGRRVPRHPPVHRCGHANTLPPSLPTTVPGEAGSHTGLDSRGPAEGLLPFLN